MWMLQIFKDSLNSSFDYLIEKIKGRFLSFTIQLILSYVAVIIFTLLVGTVVFTFINQGQFGLDLYTFDGLYAWARMVDPVWTVTLAITTNYLFNRRSERKSMIFTDLYSNKSSNFWLELVIALTAISVILTIYYKNEILLSYSGQTPLELLLSEGEENLGYSYRTVVSNWIYYLVMSLPVVAIVIVEIRERKRKGVAISLPVWKVILSAILMSFILAWIFDNLLYVFGELVLSLIYAPFEMIEIPAILGLIATLFFKVMHFMMLTAVIHFILASGTNEKSRITNPDILDEI